MEYFPEDWHFTNRKRHRDEMFFEENGKVAIFFHREKCGWQVKTNCRETYNYFPIVHFTNNIDPRLGLSEDWKGFLAEKTRQFVEEKDPFNRKYWSTHNALSQ